MAHREARLAIADAVAQLKRVSTTHACARKPAALRRDRLPDAHVQRDDLERRLAGAG